MTPPSTAYESPNRVTWRRYFKRFAADYSLGILCLALTQALGAMVPLAIKHILDDLQAGTIQYQDLLNWIGGILALIAVMFGVRVLSRYYLIGVGRKIDYDIRMNLYAHLMILPRAFFDRNKTGDLMSRLTNDLTAVRMGMGGSVMLLVNTFFAYLIVIPTMLFLSWPLTVMTFIFYPLGIWLMRGLSLKVKHAYMAVQSQLGHISDMAQENISAMTTIQSYAKEILESLRFEALSKAYFDAYLTLVRHRVNMYVLMAAGIGLSELIILGEGGREVISSSFQISSLVAFMLFLERLSFPSISLGWVLSTIQQCEGGIERINQIFESPPAAGYDTVTDQTTLDEMTAEALPLGDLVVDHLSFRYPVAVQNGASLELATLEQPEAEPKQQQSENNWVLQDLSFTVHPGQTVAIVGPVGSGKTTLLNLLVRLYEPTEGSITLANTPIQNLPVPLLRDTLTLMPQNSFLFSASMLTNLRYAEPEATESMVTQTVEAAHLHHDISQMPQGYDTLVGERGVTLSGGQRQRSALVRTLLAKPRILLLDDPFSSVDAETEAAIIEGLQARHHNEQLTTLMATQRFRWVRQADTILVLDQQGHLEAMGTHQELMNISPLYQKLVREAEEQPERTSEEVSSR